MEPVLASFEHEEDDDDFDESKLPSSGYEYLRRVHTLMLWSPILTPDCFSSKQTVHVNERSGWSPAPAGFAPSIDWQMQQAADFADIRQSFVHHRSKLGKVDSTTLILPKKTDPVGWCSFCLGDQVASKIYHSKKPDTDEDLQESVDSSSTNQEGTPPLLSVLQKINQATLLQVLEYHVDWLEEIGFSHNQGTMVLCSSGLLREATLARNYVFTPHTCQTMCNIESVAANKRGAFSTTEPNAAKIHNQERKPRSSTAMEAQPTKRSTLGRVASDPTVHKACEVQPRARNGTSPCPTIDLAQLQGETRLTDAAKLLSNEGTYVTV
ncbi:gem (nuclear organelle) associated protein 2 [Desmophyllum pertusum]|uniref:Gem (Nuclear organelle) associated protein 2 n=1 Tax=Desmophyllum pertusum TaxID=174260 RepID=A0A9W9YWH8_9CNID|nr:gem (nuclear organelle) associated protein 2 [Desmophyllum pertusum]